MRVIWNRKIFALCMLGLGLFVSACGSKDAADLPAICSGKSSSAIGGPFSLINQDGATVTEAAFQDHISLFYFGFTYCPDVCPLTLTRLKAVTDELGQDAGKISVAFVTVDPERDTPAALKAYLSNPAFPNAVIGLTGSVDQVKSALGVFKVASQIDKDRVDPSKYSVSHTSIIYLMGKKPGSVDKKWELRAFFPDTTPPADMATCVRAALAGRL